MGGVEQIVMGKDAYKEDTCKTQVGRIVIRTLLAIMSLVIAISVPSFARVVSFIGALCSFTVSGFFPAICHLKLAGKTMGCCEYYTHWTIAVSSVFCAILGTAAV